MITTREERILPTLSTHPTAAEWTAFYAAQDVRQEIDRQVLRLLRDKQFDVATARLVAEIEVANDAPHPAPRRTVRHPEIAPQDRPYQVYAHSGLLPRAHYQGRGRGRTRHTFADMANPMLVNRIALRNLRIAARS